ncbi:hypothetical protein USDA257_c17290 [Sinorhizobium fredii USDA 257]|uniref:Transmembrane protein n=1 Tax=Sinorhizobium fredii (strain USDA 257) TaxID=1185652 RepID=I3X361_SINF2|nr:hypothetical protein USDA257_c17290 [Sinorhizobium fredii USDA 257]
MLCFLNFGLNGLKAASIHILAVILVACVQFLRRPPARADGRS